MIRGWLPLFCAVSAMAAQPLRPTDISFRNEVQHAIEKGNDFLKSSQNSNGWWSTANHPSVTALALSAMMGEPKGRFKDSLEAKKGYAFILSHVQPDGGIYVSDLANYNTAICMMGLLAARDSRYDPVLRRARAYLAGSQADLGAPGKLDAPWDGGIGYSHDAGRSDMNNTVTALEALYYSRHLVADQDPAAKDLNWAAAIQFVQNCQNLPGVNNQSWVSADATDRGGFVYDPESSKAGATTNANGKVTLRSYGSISYAGLLSYIYADVKQSDARVQAVMAWLRSNFSLEENPGMGQQGYYYYLHLMTKALNATGADTLRVEQREGGGSGRPSSESKQNDNRLTRPSVIDWRHEIAMRLIDLQKGDGSWQNGNGRWWEKDSSLVTAYSVLALELIYRGM